MEHNYVSINWQTNVRPYSEQIPCVKNGTHRRYEETT